MWSPTLAWLDDPTRLVLYALAVYRLTRLVIADEVLVRPRAALMAWRGRDGRPGPLAYFLGCPWCVSIWLAAGWVLLASLLPTAAGVLAALLAFSAVAGLLAGRE